MKISIILAAVLFSLVSADHYGHFGYPKEPENVVCIPTIGTPIIECKWKKYEKINEDFGIPHNLDYRAIRGFIVRYVSNTLPTKLQRESRNEKEAVQEVRINSFGEKIENPGVRLHVKYQEIYTITVLAFNEFYTRNNTKKIEVLSSYDGRYKGPRVTHVTATHRNDSLCIEWSSPKDYFKTGPTIEHFKVKVVLANNGTIIKENETSSATNSTVLSGLKPKVDYKVFVAYVLSDNNIVGPWSAPAWGNIYPNPPTDYPKNLTCGRTQGKIKCNWKKLATESSGDAPVEGYLIEIITVVTSGHGDKKTHTELIDIKNKDTTEYTYGGETLSDAEYQIISRIAAWNIYKVGPFSPPVYDTTKGAPNKRPENVVVSFIEKQKIRYLFIAWDLPPRDHRIVGKYESYEIALSVARHVEYRNAPVDNTNEYFWDISKLHNSRGKVLTVRLAVQNKAGKGPYSDPVRILNPKMCSYRCDRTWTLFEKENKCFKAFRSMNTSYEHSMDICEKAGAILARPDSQAESNFMSELARKDIPGTGIRINVNKKRGPTQNKIWWDESGNPLKWTNWFSHTERCKDGWVASSDGFCYLAEEECKTWEEALAVCKEYGSELITPPACHEANEDLGQFLKTMMRNKFKCNKFIWLNARREPKNHPKWVKHDRSREDVTWTNWSPHEHGKDCMVIEVYDMGYWSTKNCNKGNELHQVVCKQPVKGCRDKIACTIDLCDTSLYGAFGEDFCQSTCFPNSACNHGPESVGSSENCAYMSSFIESQTVNNMTFDQSIQLQGYWYPDSCSSSNPHKDAEGFICMKAAVEELDQLRVGNGRRGSGYRGDDDYHYDDDDDILKSLFEAASGGVGSVIMTSQLPWLCISATLLVTRAV